MRLVCTFCFAFTRKLFTIFSFTFYILLSFFVKLWQQTRFFRLLFSFPQCRFFPTCSDYFLESIRKNGLALGLMLSIKRLIRCHPLGEGGIDEVPNKLEIVDCGMWNKKSFPLIRNLQSAFRNLGVYGF